MIIKLKWVVVAETILLVILLSVVAGVYISKAKIERQAKTGLLSPRVYTGVLEPKSFLITNFAPLREEIQSYIAESKRNVSVYVENLRNGAFIGINERQGFFPTSLNKLPVAIIIMKKVENNELDFGTMLEIKDQDRTDSYGELYKTNEKELPLRIVLEALLQKSDNTAINILLRQISLYDLQLILDYYGLDLKADPKGRSDVGLITPKAISNLYKSLYFSTVLEPEDSEYILGLMTNTVFDIKKQANISDEVRVSHKFGENYISGSFFHDCGIMYMEESRIFYCVMTKDLEVDEAKETVSFIVNKVYRYVEGEKERLSAYKE